MPEQGITEDYGDGFRAGFEEARRLILEAVNEAMGDYRSVRKAISGVSVPRPFRQPTGLEYRGG